MICTYIYIYTHVQFRIDQPRPRLGGSKPSIQERQPCLGQQKMVKDGTTGIILSLGISLNIHHIQGRSKDPFFDVLKIMLYSFFSK